LARVSRRVLPQPKLKVYTQKTTLSVLAKGYSNFSNFCPPGDDTSIIPIRNTTVNSVSCHRMVPASLNHRVLRQWRDSSWHASRFSLKLPLASSLRVTQTSQTSAHLSIKCPQLASVSRAYNSQNLAKWSSPFRRGSQRG